MAERFGELSLPTTEEMRQQWLRDVRLQMIDDGIPEPPVQPGTDLYMEATANANLNSIAVANVGIADSDSNILTATGDALERERIARGLPVVEATKAVGNVILDIQGSTTIAAGTQLILDRNGSRYEAVSGAVGPSDGDELQVIALDEGEDANAEAGETLTWVSPPLNVGSTAAVSTGTPITGGTGDEDDERKRLRILNALQNRPGGGNWAQVREDALNALGSVQDTYVYPALGGPANSRAIPVRRFDRARNDFSRALSASALASVSSSVQTNLNDAAANYIESAVEEPTDFALGVSIPNSVLSGGDGKGWENPAIWPTLEVADSGRVTVTAVTDTITFTVSANTAVAPAANQTKIAWWSSEELRFYTAIVVSSSGGVGAYVLTLDTPLVDSTGAGPAIGDFISPAAINIIDYGNSWLDIMEELGPGENTADASILPRGKRHPFIDGENPSDLNLQTIGQMTQKHSEIVSVSEQHASQTTPTVPGATTTVASILVPAKFGVYPL